MTLRKNLKNLETELLSERKKFKPETDILEEVAVILRENETERQLIKATIATENHSDSNAFVFDQLESDKIFHLQQIRTVAIDYRLRFLPSHFFKDGIPEEAISRISRLEKIHNIKLEGFKILAPTKAFQLLSYDDPLLFAPIGNNYYYLIHRWGIDITPTRKWLVRPFKNLWNFVVSCLLVSVILTALVPENNLSKTVPMATLIIFLFMFKSIVAIFLYAFFMMGKNFNSAIWDRKYFNN